MTRAELLKIAKPMLFNTEMVRAILEDRKSRTRRLVKLPKYIERQDDGLYTLYAEGTCYENQHMENIVDYLKKPFKIGDILYVRETWTYHDTAVGGIIYKARCPKKLAESKRWHPSLHMPKEAARIFLKVKDVHVERLQNMELFDFLNEGVVIRPEAFNDPDNAYWQAKDIFIAVWNSTINKSDLARYGWDANPWVWAIEFERIEPDDV